jgi:hypothetical protein
VSPQPAQDSPVTLSQRYRFEDFTPRVHAVVLACLGLGILVLALLFMHYREVNVWESMVAGKALLNPSYAERIYESSVFRTRANTWSNYGFVVVGAYALALAWLDSKREYDAQAGYIVKNPIYGALFGIGCVYVGIGSGFFHASLTRWGQQLDVASMYAALTALIAMNLERYLPKVPGPALRTHAIWVAGVLAASVYFYIYKWEMSSKTTLTTLSFTMVFFCVADLFRCKSSFHKLWSLLSLAVIVFAVYIRQLGVDGKFSGPDTVFQAHAIWHLLCAASLACIFLYYRSECIVPERTDATS